MFRLTFCLVALLWLGMAAPPSLAAVAAAAATPTAQAALDERTYDAIVLSAADRAEQRLGTQQNWYWGLATTVGAVMFGLGAFFGWNQLRNMRDSVGEEVISKLTRNDTFKNDIANQIEKSVLKSLQDAQANIERQVDFINLRQLAEKIDAADSVGRAEREAVLAILDRLKDDSDILQRPEFTIALRQIYSSFFQANIHDRVDDLDRQFRSQILADPAMARSGLSHYGYRLLGETDVSPDSIANMLRYVEACKALNYREVAYPFELAYLLEFQPDNWQRRVQILFEDAETLTDAEKRSFVDRMRSFSAPDGLGKNTTPYVRRIASKFAAAELAYQAQLQALVANLPPPPEEG